MVGPSTQDHALYFDSLVDMVPAKHYFEPENEALDLQYLKKADKKAAKRAMRQEGRKNKRLKLDPTAAATSLQIQQQRAARKAQEAEAAEAGTEPQGQGLQPDHPAAGGDLQASCLLWNPLHTESVVHTGLPASKEALRQRLQAKIQVRLPASPADALLREARG